MNATLILTPTPLDLAGAEIERMARAATSADGARGWWHAARIVRLLGHAGRAVRQCAQHARFHAATWPEKAAAYRGAMMILARHTGEAVPSNKRRAGTGTDTVTFSNTTIARKKGPGWMGWVGSEIAGANTMTIGPADSTSCPSHPSRTLLRCAGPHSSRA